MDKEASARAGAGARTLLDAIAALSRSLPAGPNPEIFRRAKFDRPEAAPALWQLLFRLLVPLQADRAAASLSPGAQAHLVKAVLCSYGYPRPALAQLPEDGSHGSRELLLAFSWLLARGPLLEWLLTQTCVQLGDQVPTFKCEVPTSTGLAATQMDVEGPMDLRCLQWLMGKLRFRWQCLICSQQEQCSLLSKIHTYTHGCHSDRNLGHLSITETEMLKDPEGSHQYLQALEQENARLEAALEWRRYELIFWQWMDTVLGACPPEGPAVPMFQPRISEHECDKLKLVTQELQTLQEELQLLQEELQVLQELLCEEVRGRRQAWETQVGGLGHGPEWSAARQALRQAVNQELLTLQQSWKQDRDPRLPWGPQRLVKIEAGSAGAKGLPVAEVIRLLRSQEASLEAVLCKLQGQCRQELARLVGTMPGLIWILPPRR